MRVRPLHWPVVFLACALAYTAPALAQPEPVARTVHHALSFARRDTQYVHVEVRVPAPGDVLELAMPNWTPGSYLIRDFAGQVERFEARTSGGESLDAVKIAKNRWRIPTGGSDEVVVEYDVWAGVLGVQESWVESDFALINGAGVFLYAEQTRALPQSLAVDLPAGWEDVSVALSGPDAQGRYRARDFDELVDSPLLAGDLEKYPFEAGGARFALVNLGETPQWDDERAVADLAAIAQAQIDFWGVDPFDRPYLFLNVLLGGRGGLEHNHSTVMMAAPSVMRSREEYVSWLALASHELFHAWNVRRMRPRALSEYDYEEEVYTPQLWLAEGLTSYYDNLLLFRAAVISAPEFFDLLAAEMQQYEVQPGRLVTSAELASFDSWIRHYKPNPNLVNSNSNYYRKGSLIGFVIDTAIRRETGNRQSLDDAMREMYARYGPDGEGRGSYPPGALRAIVRSLAGDEVAAQLDTLLTTPVDPDVDGALEWYGLSLSRAPDRVAAELAGKDVPVDFGVTWQEGVPDLLVEHVLHGGTAAAAGMLPGDELVAVDGLRVKRDSLNEIMGTLRPGQSVELTLARHGRLIARTVRTQHALPAKYTISSEAGIGMRQERRMEDWLGRPLRVRR